MLLCVCPVLGTGLLNPLLFIPDLQMQLVKTVCTFLHNLPSWENDSIFGFQALSSSIAQEQQESAADADARLLKQQAAVPQETSPKANMHTVSDCGC